MAAMRDEVFRRFLHSTGEQSLWNWGPALEVLSREERFVTLLKAAGREYGGIGGLREALRRFFDQSRGWPQSGPFSHSAQRLVKVLSALERVLEGRSERSERMTSLARRIREGEGAPGEAEPCRTHPDPALLLRSLKDQGVKSQDLGWGLKVCLYVLGQRQPAVQHRVVLAWAREHEARLLEARITLERPGEGRVFQDPSHAFAWRWGEEPGAWALERQPWEGLVKEAVQKGSTHLLQPIRMDEDFLESVERAWRAAQDRARREGAEVEGVDATWRVVERKTGVPWHDLTGPSAGAALAAAWHRALLGKVWEPTLVVLAAVEEGGRFQGVGSVRKKVLCLLEDPCIRRGGRIVVSPDDEDEARRAIREWQDRHRDEVHQDLLTVREGLPV